MKMQNDSLNQLFALSRILCLSPLNETKLLAAMRNKHDDLVFFMLHLPYIILL